MRSRVLVLLMVVSSCGPDEPMSDAGQVMDASVAMDAGSTDAGTPDAGAADAGSATDAGSADSGSADSGTPDAGAADSGTPDAGSADSGTPDAGSADSGAIDSGIQDAGTPDAGGTLVTCTAAGLPGTCLPVGECRDTRQPTAGLCPGPSTIQCCTPRYTNACDPNARPLPNAGLTEAPGTGSCPAGMVSIGTFCIDRYEAFLEEVDGGAWCPFVNPGTRRLRARSAAGAVPQGFINQVQAASACAESGKRLCTDAEWLRACRGPTNTTYPYGNTRLTGVCNDRRSVHPAIELYGTSASWVFSHIDSPCLVSRARAHSRAATPPKTSST